MICPKFKNINRLFVRSFKNGDSDPTKDYFDKQFMLLIEIRDFSALINNQPFFDNKHMKNLKFIELLILSKLLYTLWHRIIKTKTILQQINFTGKLEENDDAKIFFITEKKLKTILSFFFRFIKHNKII